MIRKFFLLGTAAAAILCLNGCAVPECGKSAPVPAPAKAEVKAAAPAPAAVKGKKAKYQAPALTDKDSWTMVVVPDVQGYSKLRRNYGIMEIQNAWIVDNLAKLRIRQVLFTGDLTNRNDLPVVEPGKNDLISEEQWKAFSRAVERLDGEVPYILCTGNHDYGIRSAENRNSFFGKYFPTDRNKLTRRQLIACAPNAFGVTTLENSAYEFTAPHPDNRKFLIIVLQFAPTDEDLEWAKNIADQPRFANHIGIVLTHSYLGSTGKRIARENYILSRKGGNPGEQIFQKLVYPAKNIRLVVCGHIASPDKWNRGIAFSMDKNASGKSVAQMAFNTQAIGGGWNGSGGDGWLRLLEFMPDKKTVKARTFSPFFALSPSTRHLAWKHDDLSEFSFELD